MATKIKMFTLPNMITLLNLLCGSLGVVAMITLERPEALRAAFLLMLASALFDFLDGFVARLTKQYSALGVQLDSLADMVSFGLLPSLIALQVFYMADGNGWWGAVTMLVVLFSALRLAKFNIDDSQKTEFVGLPVPANALLIGAAGWCAALYMPAAPPAWMPWTVLGCCALLAWLLISPIRMFSLKFDGFGFGPNATRYTFLLAALIFVIMFGLPGVGLSIILYILISVILHIAYPAKRRVVKK